jgi:hypothetical protein
VARLFVNSSWLQIKRTHRTKQVRESLPPFSTLTLGDHPTTFVYKGREIKVDEPGVQGCVYARSGRQPKEGTGRGKKT